MKKEVLVFIFDGYADWEPAYVCSELNAPESGYQVKTVAFDKSPKVSMGGFRVLPDYAVDEVPKSFYLLILSGGYAWMEQKNNAILPLVRYAVSHHIPVGAICNAANFMAENGFLDSIRHTGNTLPFMKAQAPHYKGQDFFIEEQAVCDAGIITANGSGTLEFAKEILHLLQAKPEEGITQWYRLNKLGFYSV